MYVELCSSLIPKNNNNNKTLNLKEQNVKNRYERKKSE